MTASAYKPGTMGKITEVLDMSNIGIDGKTYMIAGARIARVRDDNPQLGDTVEYKRAGQGIDKGNIIFFTIKERASSGKKPIDASLDRSFDPPQKPDGFKNGKDILQENLERKQAETAATPPPEKGPIETVTETDAKDLIARGEAAKMEKIQKEAAEHTEKMKADNAARKASESPKPVLAPEPTKAPEKVEQIAAIAVPDDILPATGGVELKIHCDLGSFNHFEMKVCGINGAHARQLLQQESTPTIILVKSIIKDASKGY